MSRTKKIISDLKLVFKENKLNYIGWLLGNLGGILIAYGALFIIFIFHNRLSNIAPRPEEFLITGAMSITIIGASYLELRHVAPNRLSTPLILMWPLLLSVVVSSLVALGTSETTLSRFWLWTIVVVILLLCLILSSITWLHDRGIRLEHELVVIPPADPEPPEELINAAENLPKVDSPPNDQVG